MSGSGQLVRYERSRLCDCFDIRRQGDAGARPHRPRYAGSMERPVAPDPCRIQQRGDSMRGKFPSTSALAITVMRNAAQAASEPANSGELPVWAIFDAVTALRLRRS
jgi:hypothetical protein